MIRLRHIPLIVLAFGTILMLHGFFESESQTVLWSHTQGSPAPEYFSVLLFPKDDSDPPARAVIADGEELKSGSVRVYKGSTAMQYPIKVFTMQPPDPDAARILIQHWKEEVASWRKDSDWRSVDFSTAQFGPSRTRASLAMTDNRGRRRTYIYDLEGDQYSPVELRGSVIGVQAFLTLVEIMAGLFCIACGVIGFIVIRVRTRASSVSLKNAGGDPS